MLLFYVCVIRPLVYTVSALLPAAYIIGLTFTLKTHSHIYDLHVGEGQGTSLLLSRRPLRVMFLWSFSASLFVQLQETTELWSTGQGGGPWSSSSWPLSSHPPVQTWSQRTFSLYSTSPVSHRSAEDSGRAHLALTLSLPGTALTFVLGFSSILSGWQFWLWCLRSQRLSMEFSLLSITTSAWGNSLWSPFNCHCTDMFSEWCIFCAAWRWGSVLLSRSAWYRFQFWSSLMPFM